MKAVSCSILVVLLFLVGCAPVQYSTVPKPTVQHQYELLVVDVDGTPLEGVKIEYTVKDWVNIVESGSYTTATDGVLRKSLKASMVPEYPLLKKYKTEFDFNATKDGYYPKSGTMSSNFP